MQILNRVKLTQCKGNITRKLQKEVVGDNTLGENIVEISKVSNKEILEGILLKASEGSQQKISRRTRKQLRKIV